MNVLFNEQCSVARLPQKSRQSGAGRPTTDDNGVCVEIALIHPIAPVVSNQTARQPGFRILDQVGGASYCYSKNLVGSASVVEDPGLGMDGGRRP
jgi:hypothetical protein